MVPTHFEQLTIKLPSLYFEKLNVTYVNFENAHLNYNNESK